MGDDNPALVMSPVEGDIPDRPQASVTALLHDRVLGDVGRTAAVGLPTEAGGRCIAPALAPRLSTRRPIGR